MAAPTPLSAFTDGTHDILTALLWTAGALIPLLPLVFLGLFTYAERRMLRRVWTSYRLHRTHRRSGR